MNQAWVLGQRALREAWRTPDAFVPTLFIPLFFLVVNVGQAGKIFPSASTEFLHGQGYGAFQLPQSLLLAASFGTAALFLVEEIEGGTSTSCARRRSRVGDRPRAADRRVRQGPADLDGDRRARGGVRDLDRVRRGSASCCFCCSPHCGRSCSSGSCKADRAQDAIGGGDELRQPRVLPAAVPDAELRAARHAHPPDGDRGDVQPRHLRDGVTALADPRRPRLGRDLARLPGRRRVCSLVALVLYVRVINHYD